MIHLLLLVRKVGKQIMKNMLLTNNQRKYAGLRTHRKWNKQKRFYTRCNAMEAISAFIDYCNQ